MLQHNLYATSFARIYPYYVAKVEKKGRTVAELHELIYWLTGYSPAHFEKVLEDQTDLETFYNHAPALNPARRLIKGVICGVRVEDIKEPTMQEIRYLDKIIDELAHGKPLDKILRKA